MTANTKKTFRRIFSYDFDCQKESPNDPPEKDPVFVYKFYCEKRPSSMQTVEAPYYLGINHSKDSSKCWFKASPMGVNKLTSLMKTMAGKAGFEQPYNQP